MPRFLVSILTPRGALRLEPGEGEAEIEERVAAGLTAAFARGAGAGLLRLGFAPAGAALPPDLAFVIGVERAELVSAGADLSITQSAAGSARVLAEDDLSALFGVEIEAAAGAAAKPEPAPKASVKKPAGKRGRPDERRPVAPPSPSKAKRRAAPGKVADRVSVAPPNPKADSPAASRAKTSAPTKAGGAARRPVGRIEPKAAPSKPKAAAGARDKPTLGTMPVIENGRKARRSPAKPASRR